MDIKNILIKFGIVIYTFHYTPLNAFPTNFKRLALFDTQGNIIKLVDLIGDIHMTSIDFAYKASKHRKKKFLKTHEKDLFTIAERTLLNTLREIAYGTQREQIVLLWEISRPRFEVISNIIPTYQLVKDSFMYYPFMKTEGPKLLHEFNTTVNSNIYVLDTDIIRTTSLSSIFSGIDTPEFMNYPIKSLVQPLYDLINQKNQIFNAKLESVKTNAGDMVYQKLVMLWQTYLSTTLTPFLEKYINPFVQKNPIITVGELVNVLLQTHDKNLEDEFNAFDIPIMDIETLANIFILPRQHFIVYSGSIHTDNMHKILIHQFDFTTLLDIGDNHDHIQEPFGIYSQLAPSAWKLLKLPLNTIMLSYNQQGTLIRHANRDYWEELLTIFQQNPIDVIVLEDWIKKGFTNHINSTNTRLQDKPLLIHAIERNDLQMAALLLRYGAIVNPFLISQTTPYLTSALSIAKKIGNKLMIDLLKQYGAR